MLMIPSDVGIKGIGGGISIAEASVGPGKPAQVPGYGLEVLIPEARSRGQMGLVLALQTDLVWQMDPFAPPIANSLSRRLTSKEERCTA
jgi:hypothetical protein